MYIKMQGRHTFPYIKVGETYTFFGIGFPHGDTITVSFQFYASDRRGSD